MNPPLFSDLPASKSAPDLVLLQRLEEIELCAEHLQQRPGQDLPAIFLEHNTPKTDVPATRHPLADEPGVLIMHVTHFNDLFWDCGGTHTGVIEHGVADPGLRYTGRMPRLAFVVNEPVRRWRVTGTDHSTAMACRASSMTGIWI